MLSAPTYDELKDELAELKSKLSTDTVSEHAAAPHGAEYYIDGMYHKIGVHGKAFKFTDTWTLSSKNPRKVTQHPHIRSYKR